MMPARGAKQLQWFDFLLPTGRTATRASCVPAGMSCSPWVWRSARRWWACPPSWQLLSTTSRTASRKVCSQAVLEDILCLRHLTGGTEKNKSILKLSVLTELSSCPDVPLLLLVHFWKSQVNAVWIENEGCMIAFLCTLFPESLQPLVEYFTMIWKPLLKPVHHQNTTGLADCAVLAKLTFCLPALSNSALEIFSSIIIQATCNWFWDSKWHKRL